ncbi:MAG TPA: YceI family protein [Panacibacter sp.]|nr:YceI family protein [Panacibacter sp.]HNP44104.1 YceI family protein [Panacibacter sp.]
MKLPILITFLLAAFAANSQDYITRNGNIGFYSHTSMEDIKASNNEVVSLLNSSTGTFDFRIAIKSFHFPKQSMEDHFNNPDYMDSEKFPKASFSGKITNLADVNFAKDGNYNVTVEGNLTIKNVTKPVSTKGTITVGGGKVTAKATFSVKRKEYNIIGEAFTQSKISEDIQVNVNCVYDKK